MNPAKQTYAKALAELQNRSKSKQQPSKTGGLLQRTSNKMNQDQDKPKEPYDSVLDAMDQIRTQRKKFRNGNS
jgi:hypothetical protein